MSNDQFKAFLKSHYKTECDYSYDDGVIRFKSCDSVYEIDVPKYDKDVPSKFKLNVVHVRGKTRVQGDDTGTLKMSFDSDGVITDFDPSIVLGEDHLGQVIGWAGFVVGTVVAFAPLVVGAVAFAPLAVATGATAAGLTVGISAAGVAALGSAIGTAALSATTALVVTSSASAIGLASLVLTELSGYMINDDGGRIHFPQVLAHAAARLQIAVMETRTGEAFSAAMRFDKDKWFDVVRDDDTGDFHDRQWAKDNNALEYKYKGESYRTWLPDVTQTWCNSVMIVSFKIDCDRNMHTDDHTLVLVAFDMNHKVVCGQAAMSMKSEETLTIDPIVFDVNNEPVKVPTTVGKTVIAAGSSSIERALADSMKQGLKDYDCYGDWSDQRKRVPDLVKINIDWLQKSLKNK